MNCHFRWTNSARNDRFEASVKRSNPCIHLQPNKTKTADHRSDFQHECINFWQKRHVKMLKSNLISLNRCLGSLLLLFTTRWWSSRFERQEAHELTERRGDALRCTGHAKSSESNSHKNAVWVTQFVTFRHSPGPQPLYALLVKVAKHSPPTKQASEEIPVLNRPTITEALQHLEQPPPPALETHISHSEDRVLCYIQKKIKVSCLIRRSCVYKRLAAISAL